MDIVGRLVHRPARIRLRAVAQRVSTDNPQARFVESSGLQVFEVLVANGYHPSVVEARAGVPIRLVFLRRDRQDCSDRVVFSEPRLVRHLAPQSDTIVDLPAAAAGEIRFTCGRGQYRGRLIRRTHPPRRRLPPTAADVPIWAPLLVMWLGVASALVADDPVLMTFTVSAGASLAIALAILRASSRAFAPRDDGEVSEWAVPSISARAPASSEP
jgi:hypothetical protein